MGGQGPVTEETGEGEPDVGCGGGEGRSGDGVGEVVEVVGCDGDEDGEGGADELTVELGAGGGLDEVSCFEVLHEISGSVVFAFAGRGG